MGSPSPTIAMRHRRQLSLPISRTRSPSVSVLPPPPPQAASPSSPAEWKKALNEVKQKYLGRKYRTCSARCCELLEALDDQSKMEPLHLIYLHFYAASSFEMCARPLSHSSTYRTKLLHDAREHYDRAASLIQKAEGETMEKGQTGSVSGSSYSPLTSPTMGMASPLHSPRPSISSLHSACSASAKPRKKKKVSFSGLPDNVDIPKPALQPVEPYIRPDSPTLGWEEDYILFGRSDTNPPCAATTTTPVPVAEAEVSPRTVVPERPAAASPSVEAAETVETPETPDHLPGFPTFNLESFLQAKSANRLVRELSALRSQVTFHRDGVDELLAATADEADDTPSVPELPSIPTLPGLARNISPMSFSSASESSADDSDGPVTPTSVTGFDHHAAFPLPKKREEAPSVRSPRSSTSSDCDVSVPVPVPVSVDAFPSPPLSTTTTPPKTNAPPTPRGHGHSASVAAFTLRRPSVVVAPASIPRCSSSASTTRPHHAPDEALQKRIERLRAGGWQRKRFDARRYEALREQVLGELGA